MRSNGVGFNREAGSNEATTVAMAAIPMLTRMRFEVTANMATPCS